MFEITLQILKHITLVYAIIAITLTLVLFTTNKTEIKKHSKAKLLKLLALSPIIATKELLSSVNVTRGVK